MVIYMNNGIIISTNLAGALAGPIRSTTTQECELRVHSTIIRKEICHTNRPTLNCTRKTRISEDVIKNWMSNEGPGSINPKKWKKLTQKQRLQYYVDSFDEGFGVLFEII